MVEVLEDLQAEPDDIVVANTLYMRNETDAAGVMLPGGVIKAVRGRVFEFMAGHGQDLIAISSRVGRINEQADEANKK